MSLEQFKFGLKDEQYELFPAFVAAYASEEKFHPFINQMYEKNKETYYRAAVVHAHYDHFYFSVESYEKQVIAKKLLGIMAYSYDNEPMVFQTIMEQLQKRYASSFAIVDKADENNYDIWIEFVDSMGKDFVSTRTENLLVHMMDLFKQDGFHIPNVIDHRFRPMIYYIFYSIYIHKPSNFLPFGEGMNLADIFFEYKEVQKEYAKKESPISQIQQERRKKEAYQMKKNILTPVTKDRMNDAFYFDEEDKEYKLFETHLTIQDLAELYSHASLKHAVYLPLLSEKGTKKELEAKVEEFVAMSPYVVKGTTDENLSFVYIGMLLDQLFETIKTERSNSFEQLYTSEHDSSSHIEEELQKVREEHARLQTELEKMKEEQEQGQTLMRKQKKDLEKENMELKRQLTLLNKKESKWKAKEENYINEVAVLREFEHQFLEQEEHEQTAAAVYTEKDIEYIKENNIVIAGGSRAWRQQLQDLFGKSVTFIESNQHNFDLNIIRNSSFVYLNMTHISHGFSYKIVNECKAKKIPFRFTHRKFVPYSIQELVEYIQKAKKVIV